MNERTIHITRDDMTHLRALISDLDTAARSAGDDRDRPYLAALRAGLDAAVVVPAERIPPDVVTMNSRVRLRDGRRTWVMTLVFPEHADIEEGCISVLAPLGAAVLGCQVGQRVEFRVPSGETRSCEIVSVLFQPEAVSGSTS